MDYHIFLAKTATEHYIEQKKVILPPKDLPKEFFERKAGIFITIKKNGELRGCVGTYLPTKENIAQEIISNAIKAAARDYRFNPIGKEELPSLSYEVYILGKPELISTKDVSDPPEFFYEKLKRAGLDPQKHGIITKTIPVEQSNIKDVVFNGHLPGKTGLLLPGIEGIDTVEKQISAVCEKGGINPQKERLLVYKFTVEKHAKEENK